MHSDFKELLSILNAHRVKHLVSDDLVASKLVACRRKIVSIERRGVSLEAPGQRSRAGQLFRKFAFAVDVGQALVAALI